MQTNREVRAGHRRSRTRLAALVGVAAVVALSCAEVGTGPNEAAAIEMPPFPSPSVVIGDTLRNIDGAVSPVRAIALNVRGEVIADAPVRYVYADALRDSALVVDTVTGIVRALRVAKADARIAARIGPSLQVLRPLIVTTRPDSVDRNGQTIIATLTTTFPDTGRTRANLNTTTNFSVTVRHVETPTSITTVNGWPVRYELVYPANPTNDTTRSAFLVDDGGRASVLDTTDNGGSAGRRVRVRADLFPAVGTTLDSVIVRAVVTYKGLPLRGSPIRMAAGVRRGS